MEIYLTHNPALMATEIWLVEDRPDGRYIAKPVALTFNKLDEGVEPNPTLVIQGHTTDRLLAALRNVLSKEGVKLESESKLEGKLEATQTHLKDMRRLVFKK